MNSKKIKVLIISIILFAIIMFTNGAYAASSKITSSATSVKVGDTITVTITGNAASWQLNLSANGPVTANGATSFSDATSSGENENVTMGTVTYKATGEGIWKVSRW